MRCTDSGRCRRTRTACRAVAACDRAAGMAAVEVHRLRVHRALPAPARQNCTSARRPRSGSRCRPPSTPSLHHRTRLQRTSTWSPTNISRPPRSLFRREIPGLWQSLRNCVRGEPMNGSCGKDLAFSATFLPQASINISARLDTAMADFLAAGPLDEAAAGQRYAELVERENPLRDSASALSMLGHNGTGRVLAFIAIPKANWRRRLNDYETLRRMLLDQACRDTRQCRRQPDAGVSRLAARFAEPSLPGQIHRLGRAEARHHRHRGNPGHLQAGRHCRCVCTGCAACLGCARPVAESAESGAPMMRPAALTAVTHALSPGQQAHRAPHADFDAARMACLT